MRKYKWDNPFHEHPLVKDFFIIENTKLKVRVPFVQIKQILNSSGISCSLFVYLVTLKETMQKRKGEMIKNIEKIPTPVKICNLGTV